MPRTIPFHLDVNCSKAIAVGLRHHGIGVTTTPEVGLLGALDQEQVADARSSGRVIFTQDRDSLRIHASGVPHPGIAYCEKDARTIGQIIRGLIDIWEILDPDDMADQVEYI
jgi:hypothetical protein